MTVRAITPYVHFNTTADKAIQLYSTALGAKIERLQRFGEVPGLSSKPENKDLIVHAQLRIGDAILFVNDAPPDKAKPMDGNVHISLDYTNVAEMKKAFEALSVRGTVVAPLHDTFWGATFGVLIDAYGIHWLFNCDKKTV